MFFILSTGRCGSMTITNLLNQSPNCYCMHEPHPQLIIEAPLYLYNDLSPFYLNEVLQASRPATFMNKHYGESNHNLSYIIPALTENYPKAKFVLLIRDGRDVVASMHARGWYSGNKGMHEWEKWRVDGQKLALFSAEQWGAMDSFSKICWHWNYKNQLIADELIRLNRDWMTVKLETIEQQAETLFPFLELNTPNTVTIEQDNAAFDHHTVHRWNSWSDQQKATFTTYCGPMMDKFYPQWNMV